MPNHRFDPGYGLAPWTGLVADYPGDDVYDKDAFRVEWGPIFHRGRLDGSARVLVIGQDPAAHEAACRRILVGEAGQRLQGLLARLGIDRSYVLLNTYLYSVFGQSAGEHFIDNAAITAYRNRWIDAVMTTSHIEAVITLGHLAESAYKQWKPSPGGGAAPPHRVVHVLHPTFPESSSARIPAGQKAAKLAEAMKRLSDSWNTALDVLDAKVMPDQSRPLAHYGVALTPADDAPIPEEDLPAGLPAWMRSVDAWAARTGLTAQEKRATITTTIPAHARAWTPV